MHISISHTNFHADFKGTDDKHICNLLSEPTIKRLLAHPMNTILERRLGYTVDFFLHCLLCPSVEYDIVAFGISNKQIRLTAAYLHYLIYSYVVNRASAIAICEAENYVIREGLHAKTDDAFAFLADALMKRDVVQTQDVGDESKRVLSLRAGRVQRAFEILTKAPIKFKVQERVGLTLRPVECAIFRFTPAACGAGSYK